MDHCRERLCGSMMVRMDAGFPEPGLLKGLESRSVPYIARIRKNEVLNRMAQPHLTQPAGRSADEPPREWFHEMSYQAESWDRARRVVLVVRERPGELYPDHFWLLTSLSRKRCEAPELLATYRKRGKPEGHMRELMDVLAPALSSAPRPKTHYRGKPLAPEPKPEPRTEAGVRPHNEGLKAAVEPAGAGVLGPGIDDRRRIGPVEAAETAGFSDRTVDLSAGHGRWDR